MAVGEYHEAFWLACVTVGPVILLAHAVAVSRWIGLPQRAARAIDVGSQLDTLTAQVDDLDRRLESDELDFADEVGRIRKDRDALIAEGARVRALISDLRTFTRRSSLAGSVSIVGAFAAAVSTCGGVMSLADGRDAFLPQFVGWLTVASVLLVVVTLLVELLIRMRLAGTDSPISLD